MLRYLSAEYIYPVSSEPIKHGVIGVDDNTGEIIEVLTSSEAKSKNIENIENYKGILVPGFVNAHCHLELSHLLGMIPERTGLLDFINAIISQRSADDEEVLAAMLLADQQMYNNGIVAVGDIANVALSSIVKSKSKLYYQTFLEVFAFNKPGVDVITDALKIKEKYQGQKVSIVPHAPYSVAPDLFAEIRKHTNSADILSIHNQETKAETDFFVDGTGGFEEMYHKMGVNLGLYHGNGKNSLQYHLPQMPQNNLILVHNTQSQLSDVRFAEQQHGFLYWCLCPNANLYIENKLPDVTMLDSAGARIVLGTDSLASNHQLSILSEMQVLQDNFDIPFEKLLLWATLNGAKALNIHDRFGSFQRGKFSGINHITFSTKGKIDSGTKIERII